MSWISTLAESYDFLSKTLQQNPGSVEDFIPIGIITLQAQLEITLSGDCDLIRAKLLDKSESSTFAPVTENSGNRTRSATPHPIFDNLEYMAGDYEKYSKNEINNKFKDYLAQLKKWCNSDPTNELLPIVYEYLEKETLVKDLITLDILKVDPNDPLKLDESQKYQNRLINKLFIRIAIEKDGVITKLWENDIFLNSFSDYYLADNQNPVGLCYISGKERKLANLHGKYIRYPGDGAKLISSNDTSNYTFRGRFELSDQAVGISIESSQKAHSALRWLIKNQGVRVNEMAIVAFGMNDFVPQPLEGSLSLFDQMSSNGLIPVKADTSADIAQEIQKAIHGYNSNLNPKEQVNLIVLDNATTGRLAILYYQELNAADYLGNMAYFHESMKWEHSCWDSNIKEFRRYVGVPKSSDLINYVFGVERQGLMEVGQKDKYYNQLLRRLLPAIVNRGRIPTDFVNRAFQNAVTPLSKSHSNWQKCISIACGIIKKYYQERRMVNYSMSLDSQNRDRSYLYGRLVAVAEKIERDAMGNGSTERTTNAMRLMAVMSKKPYSTWGRLEMKLQPYFKGIPRSQREFWSKKIGEIMDLFVYDDYLMNKQLESSFVLGYHCQLQDFYKKKNNSEIEEETQNVIQ